MAKKARFYADLMAIQPEVTGSGIPVEVTYPSNTKTKFLVDFGLFQEDEYNHLNQELFFDPKELAFVLVTHNHIDHTGRLPFLVKNGFNKKIYLTKGTSLLIGSALEDSCKVIQEDAKIYGKKRKAIYNYDDLDRTTKLIEAVDFEQTIQIDEHIRVTFFMNGHLFGAAMILVQISYEGYEDINLFFTGDYNDNNMFFDVDPLPEWVTRLPVTIVIESTYGNMQSSDVKKVFKENSLRALKQGKIEVAPVFSLGRAQEGLSETKKWQDSGELSTEIPIYLAGKLSWGYTNILLKNPEVFRIKKDMQNFLPKNFHYVDNDTLKILLLNKNPKLIFTSSGMATHGPALTLVPQYLRDSNAMIHFMGYLAENSKGYQIMHTPYGESIKFKGRMIPKFAEVYTTSEYSAHAKENVLIKLLNTFVDKRMVIVNHGQTAVQNIFAQQVVKQTNARDVGIFGGENVFRVDHWGYVKSKKVKF